MKGARAAAPCRVDLGGGTLDIWPLGLLAGPSVTVNVAVSVMAEAELRPRDEGWCIETVSAPRTADALEALIDQPSVRLPARIAQALTLPPAAIRLRTASPQGAGLGASSALAIALIGAAERALGRPCAAADARTALVRDIEVQMMGRPTGVQDQYPPQLGGALAIEHRPGVTQVRRLEVDLEALGARLIVAYSGESHISGDTNWHVVRAALDGDPSVIARLRGIAGVAARLPAALERAAWEELGTLLTAEWQERCQLSRGVSTPKIESLLASASEAGAWGGKVCGAGGGGCIAVMAPPARRGAVIGALEAGGASVLEARPTDRNLEVSAI